jgi:hypothetical protein
MEKTQVKAEFFVTSKTLSSRELAEKITIPYMVIGDKNDILKNGNMRGETFWEISTEYEYSTDINEQIKKIIYKIKQCKESLIEIVKEGSGNCCFCIVIHIENGETPSMVLDKDMISIAFELNAEIEFDTYANPYSSEF